MTIALLCSLQLRLVDLKREGCASDFFVLVWQTNTHKAERPSCFLLRRSDAQQQLIAFGRLFRIALSLRTSFASRLRRMAISLAWRPSLLASTYTSPSCSYSFTCTESRTLCHGRSSHFFSCLLMLAFGVPTR